MATLNRFQQYSQGENTITNNVLLMLSNLYEIHPKYYEEYILGLTEDSGEYQVIPNFIQQFNNQGDGFIDGYIKMRASSIIIETKINDLENIDKLLKYTKSFNPHELKLLFHLSSQAYSENQVDDIKKRLKAQCKTQNVHFYSLTYQNLVDQLKALVENYPYIHEIDKLHQDFFDYCVAMGLLPKSQHILRAMACRLSFDLNIKHKFYFDLANRGYSNFNYLGIYSQKSVRYIGTVENMIVADWDSTQGLTIHESSFKVTAEQESWLIDAIQDSLNEGWNVNEGHRFFLLKNFSPTNFQKTSSGGIFRVRFFDLDQILDHVPDKVEELAEVLKEQSWS